MKLIALLSFLMLSMSACMHHPIHQGNVLKENNVWLVQEGDTQFHVESLLGAPTIVDALIPRRVQYVEEYKNEETGEAYTRGMVIDYDNALRVKHIRRFGFKK